MPQQQTDFLISDQPGALQPDSVTAGLNTPLGIHSAYPWHTHRLAYLTTGRGDVTPALIDNPHPVEAGEVLGRLESLTLCATDISNVNGRLGHSMDEPRIFGHEACFEVIESRHPGVSVGKFMVTLGDDWNGLVEREKFRPVLPTTDDSDIPLKVDSRGPILDPASGVKAVCILDKPFKGASLIEPLAHVLTSVQRSHAFTSADRVLVLGGGCCGQMACIIAKIFGARRVTLLEVDAHRINFAVKHGFADDGINPETESSLIYRVIRNTGGAYADVVFDALPGAGLFEDPDTRSLAAELLRPDGAWVMYGAAKKMMMPTMTFLAKGIHISGAPYDSRLISFRRRAQTMALAHSLIRSGDIPVDLFISRSIDFFDEKAVIQAVLGYGRGPEIKIEIQGR